MKKGIKLKALKRNYYQNPIDKNAGSLRNLIGSDDSIKLRDIYLIFDYKDTDNRFQIGSATLFPGCRTGGHTHDNADEIYHVIDGYGKQIVGEEEFKLDPGDTFLVPAKNIHITINEGCVPLKYFWVVVNK